MAAYPVLLPVYLAQYTVRTRINGRRQQYTISAFMEGARAQVRASFHHDHTPRTNVARVLFPGNNS